MAVIIGQWSPQMGRALDIESENPEVTEDSDKHVNLSFISTKWEWRY